MADDRRGCAVATSVASPATYGAVGATYGDWGPTYGTTTGSADDRTGCAVGVPSVRGC